MRTLLALFALVLGLVGANAVSAQASSSRHHTAFAGSTSSTDATALGVFSRNLFGYSQFRQTGSSVTVRGQYLRLTPGNSYYTVVYANGNCDPAQAFPVGYFTANSSGYATLSMTVAASAVVPVASTMSMSVRMADTAADLDKDGKTGPTDVVAVAGQPSIGLIECNPMPTVVRR